MVDDLETPVSAYLKIAHGQPYAFLFESVEGGAWRGRYSVDRHAPGPGLALPRRRGRDRRGRRHRRRPLPAGCRRRAGVACATWWPARGSTCPRACRRWPPACSACIGYDMVRLVERLPDINPDPLGLPDAVHDPPLDRRHLRRHRARRSSWSPPCGRRTPRARGGLRRGAARGSDAVADGAAPAAAAAAGAHAGARPTRFASPVSREAYWRDRRAGQGLHPRPATSSRWCPATASARRSTLDPVRALPLAAAHQPLALPVLPQLPGLPAGRLLARRSWCACATARSPSARSPAPGRAARRRRRTRRWKPSCSPTPRSTPST